MTYAIVRTGGKQYRVEQGQSLLVERLPASEGDKVTLEPLLVRDGDRLADGDDLTKATVSATVVGHERGPKIRVLKFKPKKGYKRRTGHRQELTRLEVTEIKLAARAASGARKAPAKAAPSGEAKAARPKTAARKPAGAKTGTARKRASGESTAKK
jgi:large subunit ribosomal protein L21